MFGIGFRYLHCYMQSARLHCNPISMENGDAINSRQNTSIKTAMAAIDESEKTCNENDQICALVLVRFQRQSSRKKNSSGPFLTLI